mmetsp:Transcript_35850/g.112554  ORF Transcript_35850/g.112554 Transcript_35850/m.112554 type:complete len:133 (-) Transcript_35850:461-859(-)
MLHLLRAEAPPSAYGFAEKAELLWYGMAATAAILTSDAFVVVLIGGGYARLLRLLLRHLQRAGLLLTPAQQQLLHPMGGPFDEEEAHAERVVELMARVDGGGGGLSTGYYAASSEDGFTQLTSHAKALCAGP